MGKFRERYVVCMLNSGNIEVYDCDTDKQGGVKVCDFVYEGASAGFGLAVTEVGTHSKKY